MFARPLRLVTAGLLSLPGCAGERESDAPLASFQILQAPAAPGAAVPHLAPGPHGVVLSWLEPADHETYALRVATLARGAWGPVGTVARSDRFFVNWADFPSVVPVGDRMVAHWLARGSQGGYDYGVRVAVSGDAGATWSEPWVPHDDGTPTEHGFVSIFPADGGVGLVWLDGRDYARHGEAAAGHGDAADPQMALRYRWTSLEGEPGEEAPIDVRVCDCCQTDAAVTEDGVVVVYRDRGPDEVRDINVIRLVDGVWSRGVPVSFDGWEIAACPVNGPAVDASGQRVVVAWFTGASDLPRVHAAFSTDGGETFAPPIQVDGGQPLGRVDAALLPDGSALVSWLERGASAAEIRVRRIDPARGAGVPMTVAASAESRASGFPQMVRDGEGSVVFAWTDPGNPSSVRVARATVAP